MTNTLGTHFSILCNALYPHPYTGGHGSKTQRGLSTTPDATKASKENITKTADSEPFVASNQSNDEAFPQKNTIDLTGPINNKENEKII
ncbi:hypothetical protein HF086_013502 [Spodoptera exigua]|uniref:Uncharacterized protein n=1 Tax=Spodoptera exigua TaxID=7107 RepID=A0A922SBE9_SPOEX|nr:hypothetical protein HF086_013502 [Spodoptera exigua]